LKNERFANCGSAAIARSAATGSVQRPSLRADVRAVVEGLDEYVPGVRLPVAERKRVAGVCVSDAVLEVCGERQFAPPNSMAEEMSDKRKYPLSRQRKWQLAQQARGLCEFCASPSWLGGRRCLKHASRHFNPGSRLIRRAKWDAMDWKRADADIAAELGVTTASVRYQRLKHAANASSPLRVK